MECLFDFAFIQTRKLMGISSSLKQTGALVYGLNDIKNWI